MLFPVFLAVILHKKGDLKKRYFPGAWGLPRLCPCRGIPFRWRRRPPHTRAEGGPQGLVGHVELAVLGRQELKLRRHH